MMFCSLGFPVLWRCCFLYPGVVDSRSNICNMSDVDLLNLLVLAAQSPGEQWSAAGQAQLGPRAPTWSGAYLLAPQLPQTTSISALCPNWWLQRASTVGFPIREPKYCGCWPMYLLPLCGARAIRGSVRREVRSFPNSTWVGSPAPSWAHPGARRGLAVT